MWRRSKDPWDLVDAGRYVEAIARFEELYAAQEPERYLNARATALLLSGEPGAAYADFELYVTQRDKRYLADVELIFPGICCWYMGEPAVAIDWWRRALDTPYTDAAGGVRAPALLVYAGERARAPEVSKQGMQLLRKHWRRWQARLKRRASRGRLTHADFAHPGLASWPGVIVPFLLGLAEAKDVWRSARGAGHPTLRRRWECQAAFYVAVRSLATGDRAGFQKGMTRCSKVRKGRMEFEYYLARWEVQHQFPEPAFP